MTGHPLWIGSYSRRRGICQLISSCSPEIDIAVMPPQEIHEPFIIGFRNLEQRQHFFVAAARPLESLPNQMLHLILGDQSFRVRPRHRLPEIRPTITSSRRQAVVFQRQRHIIRAQLPVRSPVSCAHFDDVLEFTNVAGKAIRHRSLSMAHRCIFFSRFRSMCSTSNGTSSMRSPQRRNLNRKHVQSIVKIFSKVASSDHRQQLAVRRCDYTDIEFAMIDIAESAELSILKHPK